MRHFARFLWIALAISPWVARAQTTTYVYGSTYGAYSNANYSFHIPLTDENGNTTTLWTNNNYSYSWAVFLSGPYEGVQFENFTGGWTRTSMTEQHEPNTTGSVCNPAKVKCSFYSITATFPAYDQNYRPLGYSMTFTFYGASYPARYVSENVIYAGEATISE